MLTDLISSAAQTALIVLLGFLCRRTGVFDKNDMKGINKFLTFVSLPAVFFLSLILLDWSTVSFPLLGSLCIAKTIVYALCGVITYVASDSSDAIGLSGLFAIFATKSNDIAMGVPIVSSIWGPSYSNYLYLFAPYQLLIINLIGFVQMEYNLETAECKKRVIESKNMQEHLRVEPTQAPMMLASTTTIAFAIFKKLSQSPIIISTVLGFLMNLIIGHNNFPEFLTDLLGLLSSTYSGASLFALGLSIETTIKAGQSLLITSLVATKVVLLPLVMALVTIGITKNDTDVEFAFIYGMLPTSPTLYIFAVSYKLRESLISSSCLVCLIASVPFILISGIALQMRSENDESRSNEVGVIAANWFATLSTVGCVVTVTLAYLAREKRRLKGCWRVYIILTMVTAVVSAFNITCIERRNTLDAQRAVMLAVMQNIFTLLQRAYGVILAAVLFARLTGDASTVLKVEIRGHICAWTCCLVIGLVHGTVLQPSFKKRNKFDISYERETLSCGTVDTIAYSVIELLFFIAMVGLSLWYIIKFQTAIKRQCLAKKLGQLSEQDEEQKHGEEIDDKKHSDLIASEKADENSITTSLKIDKEVNQEVEESCRDSTRYTSIALLNACGLILATMCTMANIFNMDNHAHGYTQVVFVLDCFLHLSLGVWLLLFFVTHEDIYWGVSRTYARLIRFFPCIERIRVWIFRPAIEGEMEDSSGHETHVKSNDIKPIHSSLRKSFCISTGVSSGPQDMSRPLLLGSPPIDDPPLRQRSMPVREGHLIIRNPFGRRQQGGIL